MPGEVQQSGIQQNAPFRILHLEDDDNDALLMKRAVMQSGIPVELVRYANAPDAVQALTSSTNGESSPQLVLSDLKMPGMSGAEFTCWLRRSRHADVPVVILTGSSLVDDMVAAYECGANAFATKPVSVLALTGVVGNIVRYYSMLSAHGMHPSS